MGGRPLSRMELGEGGWPSIALFAWKTGKVKLENPKPSKALPLNKGDVGGQTKQNDSNKIS